MMSDAFLWVLQAGLAGLVLMLLPLMYRVIVGPTAADRLQAVDVMTTVLIGIIVLLAVLQGTSMLIDIALALAAFGFIATIGIARYLAEGRMF